MASALLSTLGLAAPASGLSFTLTGPTAGPLVSETGVESSSPGSQITFTLGLDAATAIQGYDLTIAWDAAELSFFTAAPVAGLPFFPAPNGSLSAGSRVASLTLTPVTTATLFSATFDVLAAVPDGLADFSFFVDDLTNGSGIAPASLSIANPGGAGIDVVPEPGTAALLAIGLAITAALRRRLARH